MLVEQRPLMDHRFGRKETGFLRGISIQQINGLFDFFTVVQNLIHIADLQTNCSFFQQFGTVR